VKASAARKSEARALLAEFARTKDPEVREALLVAHEHLAAYLARKFANRGEALEDLLQVARMGLLKAIDRYNPSLGFAFTTFATPTIVGEIKRHFRDRLWIIKVPRSVQDLTYRIRRTVDEMTVRLGHSPSIGEICAETGLTFEEVTEVLEISSSFDPLSLDADTTPDGLEVSLADALGGDDEALGRIELRDAVERALSCLSQSHRVVVYLRFFGFLSQAATGRRMGLSQMQVSRLEQEAIRGIRQAVMGDSIRIARAGKRPRTPADRTG